MVSRCRTIEEYNVSISVAAPRFSEALFESEFIDRQANKGRSYSLPAHAELSIPSGKGSGDIDPVPTLHPL